MRKEVAPSGAQIFDALNHILSAHSVNRNDGDLYVRVAEGFFGPLYSIVACGLTMKILATRLPQRDETGERPVAIGIWVLDRRQADELISGVTVTV